MRYGAIISGLVHVLVLVFVFMGLPDLFRSERPEMAPIPIEVVNIDDVAQQLEPQEAPKPPRPEPLKASPRPDPKPEPPKVSKPPPPPPTPEPQQQAVKIPEPEPMPPEKKPEPPRPEPPKPEPPKPEPPKPEPEPAEKVKPEPPKPQPKPAPPKPEPKPEPPKPKPEAKKPEPKKPEPPKPEPKKAEPKQDDFQALLKNLAKEKRVQQQQQASKTEKPAAETRQSEAPRRSAMQTQMMAATLAQSVMRQVSPCWTIPAGAKNAADMDVAIRIRLNPDGSLGAQPKIEDTARLGSDLSFRTVAESAIRALRDPKCMPLKLPYDQYDLWKDITFVFDPREALGQ